MQRGYFSLVGEAGRTKDKEETGVKEHLEARKPAGKVLPQPKCDASQDWTLLLGSLCANKVSANIMEKESA